MTTTKADFKFGATRTDDELRCDRCGNLIIDNDCWTAMIPGYGSSGIAVFCDLCYQPFAADLK
jgi:hypothetical protein